MAYKKEPIIIPESIALSDIHDYIENGDVTTVPDKIRVYLDLLEKVRDMKRRPREYATKNHIINHLMKVNELSRYMANKIHDDCIEYFYLDSTISKEAYRNLYAEQQDEDIALARLAAQSIEDLDRISKMREKAYKFRQLDVPDVEDFPEGLFDRPFKLYTMEPENVGIPKADRRELSARIDGYIELSELEKEILKREAGVLPRKMFLEDYEDPRYDER
ncbi:MAG TPA: hypothetical protein VLY84_00235 [Dysgonamonadaceae bacterium]|nr:hypothetical protein [Dysgonamonadaceae bacterium]